MYAIALLLLCAGQLHDGTCGVGKFSEKSYAATETLSLSFSEIRGVETQLGAHTEKLRWMALSYSTST